MYSRFVISNPCNSKYNSPYETKRRAQNIEGGEECVFDRRGWKRENSYAQ